MITGFAKRFLCYLSPDYYNIFLPSRKESIPHLSVWDALILSVMMHQIHPKARVRLLCKSMDISIRKSGKILSGLFNKDNRVNRINRAITEDLVGIQGSFLTSRKISSMDKPHSTGLRITTVRTPAALAAAIFSGKPPASPASLVTSHSI